MKSFSVFIKILLNATFLFLLSSLTACGGGTHTTASSDGGRNRNATIEIRDEADQPVEGALILDINGGAMVQTDANGQATIQVSLDEANQVSLQVTRDGTSSDVSFPIEDSETSFDATLRLRDNGQLELESLTTDGKKNQKKKPQLDQTPEPESTPVSVEEPSNENPAPSKEKKESPEEPKASPTPTPAPEAMKFELRTSSNLYEPGDTFSASLQLSGDIDQSGNLLGSYEGKTVIFLIGEDTGESTTVSFSNGFLTFPSSSEDPFFQVSYQNYRSVISNGRADFSFQLPEWLPGGIYRLKIQALVTTSTATFLYAHSNLESIRLVAP